MAYYALEHGEPKRALQGYDSWGNICGQKNKKIPGSVHPPTDTTNLKWVINSFKYNIVWYFKDFYVASTKHDPNKKACVFILFVFRSLFYFDPLAITRDDIPSIRVCVRACPGQPITSKASLIELSQNQNIHLCRYDVTPNLSSLEVSPREGVLEILEESPVNNTEVM